MSNLKIAKKLCNFLIEDAKEDLSLVGNLADLSGFDFHGLVVESVLNQFKEAYGGLWVGGAAILTQDHINFTPNTLNEIFHKGDNALSIPLAHIFNIDLEFGFLTKIIAVTTPYGIFKFRCFGAQSFMQKIESQIQHRNT
ncbi:hypothetical protein [Pseudoalteromonas rubra]|uniref:Uncharacterized protein n=1 Tax=Pseudoalteromonas rubra TaxID=43658 RepID=A0A0U3I3D8_9GAMM|nr:hypothetical protein [Pseudoalteromonas rubra]ALU42176.1 hypothetical protein AT705_04025 [Pseudoalteromonas rubra]